VETRIAKGGTVIVGGGFAGASVARELGRRGCTVVAPDDELVYTPLLAEATSGELELARVSVPVRTVCPNAEILLGRVTDLDRRRRCVTVQMIEGATVLVSYEQLVLAVGAVESRPAIPGLREHALGTKTIPGALATRDHVLGQLAAAAEETDPDRLQRHLTFVVVGAGYAGVETLAELRALARDAVRDHPSLRYEPQRWVLVDAAAKILSDVPPRLGEYAKRELESQGVEVRTATALEMVEADRAVFSDGTTLETATVIWAAGAAPNPVIAALGLPVGDTGRIRVGPTLQVEGEEGLWAAGDCAEVPNGATPGRPDPPTSQHALRQAGRVAKNIAAVRAGLPPQPYRYLQLGQVATLGRYHGIADVFGVQLTGLPGWVAARTVHLLQYPDPLRRLAIVNDWTLSLVFRRNTRASGPQ
jgi:NADH:ubiquinone reductase (H+-translocating)